MTALATTIYNQIRSAIPTLTGFTTKTEIKNPFDVSQDNVNLKRDGYAVLVGSSSPAAFSELRTYRENQIYSVILTREVKTLAHDNSALVAATQAMLDDTDTLKKDFLAFDQLGIDSSVEKVDVLGTSAITTLEGGKFNFIQRTIDFNFLIREILT